MKTDEAVRLAKAYLDGVSMPVHKFSTIAKAVLALAEENERLRAEQSGTVVVDGLAYGEHMTRALRMERDQLQRDFTALSKLIARTVGTEDDREAAEMDELDEFDPWHALRQFATTRRDGEGE